MSRIDTLLDDLQQWSDPAGYWTKPRYQRVSVSIDPERLTDPNEVRSRIDEHLIGDGAQGWIETTDKALTVAKGDVCPKDVPVLNAELCALQTRHDSLHVRQIDDGWRITRMREDGAVERLALDIRLENAAPADGALCYRVYYQLADDGGLRACAARFAGFGEPAGRK